MENIRITYIKRISFWGRFAGLFITVYGLASILMNFFTSLTYIITGFLTIILGLILFDLGREGKKALRVYESGEVIGDGIVKKYSLYLAVFGGYIIVAIIYIAIYFIIQLN